MLICQIKEETKGMIEKYIKKHKMTVGKFAARCGVSKVTIINILEGKRTIHRQTILKIYLNTGLSFEKMYWYRAHQRNYTNAVVNVDIVFDFYDKYKFVFCDFCHQAGIKMREMRNILNFRRPTDNENFFKLARFIGVPVEKLFEGIPDGAKALLKKYQGEDFLEKMTTKRLTLSQSDVINS